jgi:hypothetical protein
VEECGPYPVFASFTLAFAVQPRKKNGKISVRVRKTSVRLTKTSEYSIHISKTPTCYKTHTNTLITTPPPTHTHITKQYKTTTVQIKTNTVQDLEVRASSNNSNKSPTRCNNFTVYYPDVYLQLNMFWGVFPPIIRSSMTAVAASGFAFVSW